MKLLADVDTGIDDAFALLYLCGCDDIELVAVTTTSGNTTAAQAATNTRAVLAAAGCPEVEVAAGTPVPLVRPLVTTPETHGPTGLGYAALPAAGPVSDRPWLELWREQLTAYPGELTLLITGPLTNLAVALREIPALPRLVGRIVIMGGCFWHPGNTTPTAEWNTWCDPDAAKAVYAAFEGLPTERLPVVCATQVTEAMAYTPERLDALLERCGAAPVGYAAGRPRTPAVTNTGHPVLDLICGALRFYFEFHQDYDRGYFAHLHDLVAAQVALGRAYAPTSTTVVDVEAGSDLTRGTTLRDDRGVWGRRPNARILEGCRPEELADEFARAIAALVRRTPSAAGARRGTGGAG